MLSERVRRGCLRLGLAGLVPAMAFGLIAVAIGLHSDWQRSQSPISLRTADVTIELPASFSVMDAPGLCKAMRDTRGPWNHFQAGRTVPLPGVVPVDETRAPQPAAPTSSETSNRWQDDPIVDTAARLQGPLADFTSVGPDECIKRVGIYVNDIRHQGRDAAFATALTSVLFGGGWFICCWGFGWVLRGFMA